MSDSFVTQLDRLGYFEGLPTRKARTLKADFEQRGWAGIFSESHRFYLVDAENLAESGIGDFIREVEPFLAAQGVRLPEIQDDSAEDGYAVRVGAVPSRIYDRAEMERDFSGEQMGLIWGLSTVRGFRIVDELLAAAGSAERVFAVEGGNDLCAMFLTPELHRVIMERPDASPAGGPYRPTEEYPWFGQPHDE